MFVDLMLLRHATLANLFGSEELSNADVRAAAGALWDSYLGELSDWALGARRARDDHRRRLGERAAPVHGRRRPRAPARRACRAALAARA